VEAEKLSKANKNKMSSPAPSSGSPTQTVATAPASNLPYKGNIEKRKFQTDNVNVKRTGDETRDNCIGLIYNGLAYRSTASENSVITKAVEIEKAAYHEYKGTTKEYKDKMRSLFSNLKNRMNQELGPRVLDGSITAARFVVMTHEQLKSAEQKKQEESLQIENMKKAQVPMAEKSISDALKCGKCGQKKVSYSQAQTRSADEPMTTFCECTVCGNRWKVSHPIPLYSLPPPPSHRSLYAIHVPSASLENHGFYANYHLSLFLVYSFREFLPRVRMFSFIWRWVASDMRDWSSLYPRLG
jgi:transcription elongation factor S-II